MEIYLAAREISFLEPTATAATSAKVAAAIAATESPKDSTCFSWNVRSSRKDEKLEELPHVLSDVYWDIILINETWRTEEEERGILKKVMYSLELAEHVEGG